MASSITNEACHVHTFSPLPQSETQEEQDQEIQNHHDDDEEEDDEEWEPLSSISVESMSSFAETVFDPYYSDEVFSVSAHMCEVTQDFLGLMIFIVLVFLPLYRRLGVPNEDPVPPVFVINSMYLSNFITGKGGLCATWDAKFTIKNINVSAIYFRNIDFTIFYQQNPEDSLSVASSYPFYLDEGEYVKLHLKFEKTGLEENQTLVGNRLVEEIGRERAKDGSLSFGMQIKVKAIYYGETWVSDVVMNPHCEDLKVQFLPNNRNFSVPIEWKPFSFF